MAISKELTDSLSRVIEKVAKRVDDMVRSGEVLLPPDYNPGNALQSAKLELMGLESYGKPAIGQCDPASVPQALLKMVLLGLSPAKTQCYFYVERNSLVLKPSYFGSMRLARLADPRIKDITAQVIYEGDETSVENEGGYIVMKKHVLDWTQTGDESKIRGAYCNIIYEDGTVSTTVMSMAEIRRSWNMRKGKNRAQEETPGQMAKRTVINRACKAVIGAFGDSYAKEAVREDTFAGAREDLTEMVEKVQNTISLDLSPEGESDAN